MTFSNNNYRAVVFDFGGVLVDWNPLYLYSKIFNGDSQAAEKFLTEIGFEDWNTEMDRRRSLAGGIADLCRRFPQHAELIQVYDRRWEESVSGPIESNVQLLRTLKAAGYPVYGLSNCSVEKYWVMHHKYDFFAELDAIVLSGEVELLKPDPRIYEALLHKAGKVAKECVLIDDSAVNVAAAREQGWDAIHYQSPSQLQNELKQRGLPHPGNTPMQS
jgi:2-haloacid dehalogenase